MMSTPLRIAVASLLFALPTFAAAPADPLLDWSDWQKYRAQIPHPSLAIKPADVTRAKENIRRHDWAKHYLKSLQDGVDPVLPKLTPDYVAHMIEATTPDSTIFTPCPACRDEGKPVHPQGEWSWSPDHPDQITCKVCGTTFPNPKYPESIALHSKWDPNQTFTFYGGDTFVVFQYKKGRPSFTGNIRAQKVVYMAGLARRLAEVYTLTGDARYARVVEPILYRFAEVFPKYLVHVGYGEFADIDPHVAAFNIEKLPQDELVYPPNKPDRKLHTGYWSAGRMTGHGMEGVVLRQLVEAYDLTVAAPGVYTEPQKLKIEKDLLLEATVLPVADKAINNKSVSQRSAVGMVGISLGLPSLFRFGNVGFTKTVDDYFLPDGAGPESPSYTLMAVNGVDDFATAIRGYSDPAGYHDPQGHRIDNLDPYHDPRFAKIWQAFFDIQQGDLTFPPIADTHPFTGIPATQVEEMADFFPENPQYAALLKEQKTIDPATAIYYRDPLIDEKPAPPPLKLPDICYPDQRIGLMRTGTDGRESLLLLSASHWGVHHHEDSLNLYYWKAGRELLSDLGYLWDHPDKKMTDRTLAHNLVIIDQKDQATKDRAGTMELFHPGPHIKVMRATSHAYPNASLYRRTAVLIDHGAGHAYAVDLFEVTGGQTQDYVFHGPDNALTITGANFATGPSALYDFKDIKTASPSDAWQLHWQLPTQRPAPFNGPQATPARDNPLDPLEFTATMLPQEQTGNRPAEIAFVASGWGQRDYHNTDRGATLPYIVRRSTGQGRHVFASVFEGHAPGKPFVTTARRLTQNCILIQTPAGNDYVCLGATPVDTPDGRLQPTGSLTVLTAEGHTYTDAKSAPRLAGKELTGTE